MQLWAQVGQRKHVLGGSALVQPDEYDLTIHVWRRCGLTSNYIDHLFYHVVDEIRWTKEFT